MTISRARDVPVKFFCQRGARALAKEEEREPGEDWEGEERPEEYAGLFDDP